MTERVDRIYTFFVLCSPPPPHPPNLTAVGKLTNFFETRNTVHLKIYTILRYEVLTAVTEN
jgi:hypothetical protein